MAATAKHDYRALALAALGDDEWHTLADIARISGMPHPGVQGHDFRLALARLVNEGQATQDGTWARLSTRTVRYRRVAPWPASP